MGLKKIVQKKVKKTACKMSIEWTYNNKCKEIVYKTIKWNIFKETKQIPIKSVKGIVFKITKEIAFKMIKTCKNNMKEYFF